MSLGRISSSALLVVVATLSAADLAAQQRDREKVFTAEHRYTLGDNDSRNDARTYCLLEVKRQLLEQAGVYVESNVEVRGASVSKSEVRSIAAGVLAIERLRETVDTVGERQIMVCAARTTVNVEQVQSQLNKILNDADARRKLVDQQTRVVELEKTVAALRRAAADAPSSDALSMRQQRVEATREIASIEEQRGLIIAEITRLTRTVTSNVALGMNRREVETVAGKARARETCSDREYWSYGQVWVVFYSGIVRCFVAADRFRGQCSTC